MCGSRKCYVEMRIRDEDILLVAPGYYALNIDSE
jgi:hypothetical protein